MTQAKKTMSSSVARLGGFSLVEVLVALLVLSIGLLGLAALQTTSLKYNTGSYLRTQATYFVYDIVDRMRANTAEVTNGGTYDVANAAAAATAVSNYGSCKSSGCACNTSSCSASNLAAYDLGTWYERMEKVLPDAATNRATIDINGSKQVTITIHWKEQDLSKQQTWVMQL